jgi:hypothetical protein
MIILASMLISFAFKLDFFFMRFKNRYALFQVIYDPSLATKDQYIQVLNIQGSHILHHIKTSLLELGGEYALGVLSNLQGNC